MDGMDNEWVPLDIDWCALLYEEDNDHEPWGVPSMLCTGRGRRDHPKFLDLLKRVPRKAAQQFLELQQNKSAYTQARTHIGMGRAQILREKIQAEKTMGGSARSVSSVLSSDNHSTASAPIVPTAKLSPAMSTLSHAPNQSQQQVKKQRSKGRGRAKLKKPVPVEYPFAGRRQTCALPIKDFKTEEEEVNFGCSKVSSWLASEYKSVEQIGSAEKKQLKKVSKKTPNDIDFDKIIKASGTFMGPARSNISTECEDVDASKQENIEQIFDNSPCISPEVSPAGSPDIVKTDSMFKMLPHNQKEQSSEIQQLDFSSLNCKDNNLDTKTTCLKAKCFERDLSPSDEEFLYGDSAKEKSDKVIANVVVPNKECDDVVGIDDNSMEINAMIKCEEKSNEMCAKLECDEISMKMCKEILFDEKTIEMCEKNECDKTENKSKAINSAMDKHSKIYENDAKPCFNEEACINKKITCKSLDIEKEKSSKQEGLEENEQLKLDHISKSHSAPHLEFQGYQVASLVHINEIGTSRESISSDTQFEDPVIFTAEYGSSSDGNSTPVEDKSRRVDERKDVIKGKKKKKEKSAKSIAVSHTKNTKEKEIAITARKINELRESEEKNLKSNKEKTAGFKLDANDDKIERIDKKESERCNDGTVVKENYKDNRKMKDNVKKDLSEVELSSQKTEKDNVVPVADKIELKENLEAAKIVDIETVEIAKENKSKVAVKEKVVGTVSKKVKRSRKKSKSDVKEKTDKRKRKDSSEKDKKEKTDNRKRTDSNEKDKKEKTDNRKRKNSREKDLKNKDCVNEELLYGKNESQVFSNTNEKCVRQEEKKENDFKMSSHLDRECKQEDSLSNISHSNPETELPHTVIGPIFTSSTACVTYTCVAQGSAQPVTSMQGLLGNGASKLSGKTSPLMKRRSPPLGNSSAKRQSPYHVHAANSMHQTSPEFTSKKRQQKKARRNSKEGLSHSNNSMLDNDLYIDLSSYEIPDTEAIQTADNEDTSPNKKSGNLVLEDSNTLDRKDDGLDLACLEVENLSPAKVVPGTGLICNVPTDPESRKFMWDMVKHFGDILDYTEEEKEGNKLIITVK